MVAERPPCPFTVETDTYFYIGEADISSGHEHQLIKEHTMEFDDMKSESSRFITGLVLEDQETLAAQLALWHHLTLGRIMQYKVKGWVVKRDELYRFLEGKTKSASKEAVWSLRHWKLNAILEFCQISPQEVIDFNALIKMGQKIEQKSIICLQRIDQDFNGSTIDEMVPYLLGKILHEASEHFRSIGKDEADKRVGAIIAELKNLSSEQQDELKTVLGIDAFTRDGIRSAIYDHSLSAALTTLMSAGRLTLYIAVAKISVGLSGLAGLYFAKPFIKPLLPAVLMIFNPVILSTIGVGLIWWTEKKSNSHIRSFLLPTMVMSAYLASLSSEEERSDSEKSAIHTFVGLLKDT